MDFSNEHNKQDNIVQNYYHLNQNGKDNRNLEINKISNYIQKINSIHAIDIPEDIPVGWN